LRIRRSVGDHDRIPNGTPVVIDYSLGAPYIDGILPPETRQTAFDNPANVTDTVGHGGEDPMLNRSLLASGRGAGEPNDILPGDFVRTSPDGAAIGALHGKVAMLRGSSLSQIKAHGENDNLEIISGTYRHISWMGESRIVNNQGKTSWIWRGGSDQLTQTGADEEHYTLHADLGDTGDLVNFRVTTPQGNDQFRFHVSPEGRLQIYARGGIDMTGGGNRHLTRLRGEQNTEIDGPRNITINGTVIDIYEDQYELSVSDNVIFTFGRDHNTRVNRDISTSSGGACFISSIQEMHLSSQTSHFVVLTPIGNISFLANTGNVLTQTGPGNVTYELTSGNFRVYPSANDSIIFGEGAISHAVKYEELSAQFQQFLASYNLFKAAVVAHFHVPPTGPSGTLTPFAPPTVVNLVTARSSKVKLL
jgi:hypothetical protein